MLSDLSRDAQTNKLPSSPSFDQRKSAKPFMFPRSCCGNGWRGRASRLTIICSGLLAVSICMIVYGLMLTQRYDPVPSIPQLQPHAVMQTLIVVSPSEENEIQKSPSDNAAALIATRFPVHINKFTEPPLLEDGAPMRPSSCRKLMSESKQEANQLGQKIEQAFKVFIEEGGLDRQSYCIVRCDLRACCAHGERVGIRWLHVIKNDLDAASLDVTLVTQGTVDRVENFHIINHTWPGPKVVVFVIYNNTVAKHARADKELAFVKQAASAWKNTLVLVCVIHDKTDFFTKTYSSFKDPLLPVNTLRNIVADHAPTNFIFPLDIDFIPSHRLYHKLRYSYLPLAQDIDRVVIVVPHWETLRCAGSVSVPTAFSELHEQAKAGAARPFHVATSHLIPLPWPPAVDMKCENDGTTGWTPGIRTTNYFRWFRESQQGYDGMFPVATGGGPTVDRYYEPFVVLRRVEANGMRLPRYQEQFVGRYKNKIAFVSALRAWGYQFFTLRKEFVVHVPHPVSNQTTADMQGLLLMMRTLHREERMQLHEQVYTPSGALHPPPLLPSRWDQGFRCHAD